VSPVPDDARFATRAVHAGLDPDPSFGSIVPPIHQTSTYVQPAPGQFVEDFDYARSANPTRSALERALGELEGGLASCFSSGMAATHALLSAHCSSGDHVILPRDLYGGTYRLVDKVMTRFGLLYDMVDQTDLGALERALRPETTLIWVETPTNPLLNLVDIEAVVARKGAAIVAVDNTFATPVVQRPLEMGVDAVVHSATKYLGGHNDVVGGIALFAEPERHAAAWRELLDLGACADPFAAWLVLRGVKTLALRMRRHGDNARLLAELLVAHPKVERVYWPGLPTHPTHRLATKLLDGDPGLLSFDLAGGRDAGRRFIAATRVAALAPSLGGLETLVSHPASTTHRQLDADALAAAGIGAGMVRVSVGLEDGPDLADDFTQALERA
jgi:cystathionine gamma-synthase